MKLSAELQIETPEGIRFSYALAGPIVRCFAWLIDLVVILLLTMAVGKALSSLAVFDEDLTQALQLLAFPVLSSAYGVCLEWWWRGQTVGKRLLHLRVMDAHGLRLHFHQVLMRNLLRAIDFLPLPYLVGGLCCALSRRAQRLGDLAAGTVVVHHPQPFTPDLEQLLAGKFNSLRTLPHLAARLRQRVTPHEASVALQAVLRREEFAPSARVELFGLLATHFRVLVPYPPEVTEALPEEQYVRNVVDILYRARAGAAGKESLFTSHSVS